jgi:hypothetical protein
MEGSRVPAETIVILIGTVAVFVIFGVTLAWVSR